MLAKVTSKNQLTLPRQAMAAIGAVSHFQVEVEDGCLILTPAHGGAASAVRRKLAELGLADADVDEAVAWVRRSGGAPGSGARAVSPGSGARAVRLGQALGRCRLTSARPPRVVFDTKMVVSALVFGQRRAWLRAAWARRAVVPLTCRETTAELLRVLACPKFRLTAADRQALLADYLRHAAIVVPAEDPESRDPDDTVSVRLAVAGRADFLVSGERARGCVAGANSGDQRVRG